jgi:acyl-CoA synthetase (NDP forming)
LIGISGADPTLYDVTTAPLVYIRKYGYNGQVYPINPKSDEILGYKVYRSVTEIPGDVDLVVTALPTPNLPLKRWKNVPKKE